jgi:serpin B
MKNLTNWKNNFTEKPMKICIPKFKIETKYFLKENLIDMGMVYPFIYGSADFSGLDGTKYLFIDSVIHLAFVEVNEEGTEAAAATAVIINSFGPSSLPSFRVDHPFIFLIQHRDSGNILFMGRVVNPSM